MLWKAKKNHSASGKPYIICLIGKIKSKLSDFVPHDWIIVTPNCFFGQIWRGEVGDFLKLTCFGGYLSLRCCCFMLLFMMISKYIEFIEFLSNHDPYHSISLFSISPYSSHFFLTLSTGLQLQLFHPLFHSLKRPFAGAPSQPSNGCCALNLSLALQGADGNILHVYRHISYLSLLSVYRKVFVPSVGVN